ncbi:hypothetical protein AVEN_69178-1 [Araneus ventricosus]|uniref:Uncharacterized protein n=1 Tax=Araneus ventricosus TaxID=182803 RepID=A0A4Y2MNZ8_ARAVE|nr:hypothetical protein AVEN_69178-1 [Araneus ventricosus]
MRRCCRLFLPVSPTASSSVHPRWNTNRKESSAFRFAAEKQTNVNTDGIEIVILKQGECYFETDFRHFRQTTPQLAHPSPNFRITPAGDRLIYDIRFILHQAHIHVEYSRWNRLSSMELSVSEVKTLPLNHFSPLYSKTPKERPRPSRTFTLLK